MMSETSRYPAINKAGHLVTLAAAPGEALTPALVERATGLPDAFDRVRDHLADIHFTEEGSFTGLAESYARMARADQQRQEAPPFEQQSEEAALAAWEKEARDTAAFEAAIALPEPIQLPQGGYGYPDSSEQQQDAAPVAGQPRDLTADDRAAFAAKAAALEGIDDQLTPEATARLRAAYLELAEGGGNPASTSPQQENPAMIIETLVAAAVAPETTGELIDNAIESIGTIALEAADALAPSQDAAPQQSADDIIAAREAALAAQRQEQTQGQEVSM